MTFEEAREIVRSVSFCGGFAGMAMELYPPDGGGVVLKVSWQLPDRDDQSRMTVIQRCTGASPDELARMKNWEVLSWVHREFGALVDHEQCEGFKVDGVRVFDPHDMKPGGRAEHFRRLFT